MKAQNPLLIAATILLALTVAGCDRFPSSRSDQQVTQDVQGRIQADTAVANKQIAITANNGIVTLNGTVTSEAERQSAANDAANVAGVKTVVNNLTVAAAATEPAPEAPASGGISRGRTYAPAHQRASSTRGVNPGPPPASAGTTMPTNAAAAGATNAIPAATGERATTPAVAQVLVPSGAPITIITNAEINSETANPGDRFSGVLDDPIYVDNVIAIPRNADVQGRVVDVKSAGKFKGASEIVLQLTSLSYNGHSYSIKSSEWRKAGSSRGKNTAAKVGGGAAVGAIIGGIAGGGKGAAIGAAAGAGVGAGAQAVTHGQQIILKPETTLQFTLEGPVRVTPSDSASRAGRLSPSADKQ